MTCDCTARCGDDPQLKDGSGRATPCLNRLDLQERERQVSEQLAKITRLRKTYRADNLYELLDNMQAEVVLLKGEAKVMRDLLKKSITVLDTIEEDDAHERALLHEFKLQMSDVIDIQLVRP